MTAFTAAIDSMSVRSWIRTSTARPRAVPCEDPFEQTGAASPAPRTRERFERPVRAARQRRRRHMDGILENGDEASRDEFGTTCMKEQRRASGEDSQRCRLELSPARSSRPVPCSRVSSNSPQTLCSP